MKRISIIWILIAVGFVLNSEQLSFAGSVGANNPKVSPTVSFSSVQDFLSQVENLIREAREQGLGYLNSKDDKAKKVAKKNLEEAEKLLKNGLKQNSNCEKCLEFLVTTYFYQTYFGFSKNYDECIKTAAQGLEQFSANSRLVYYKGYAHYNSGQYSESVKAFSRFLLTPSDAQTESQVRQLLQDSQQRFLANWNRHANYYQLPESMIMGYNPQTYRQEPIFQVTPAWEMNLGSQGFTALTAKAAKMEDAEIQAYLENLVSRLTGKSPGSPFEYKITIVNAPEVNAVTTPGFIVVYTGLLASAENESELAGVLAHELAHNYAHHQARAVIKNYYIQNIANAVIQIINPQTAAAQVASRLGAAITTDLFARAFSRSEEKEADLYGSHILFNAGYNPTALSTFFLKLYKANPKQPAKFLSTHPPAPDRATYLTDYLESFPLDRELQLDSKDFQKMKNKLATLLPTTQPKTPGRGVLPNQ